MACLLTQGMSIGCGGGSGGIKNFYLANKVADFGVTPNASGIATDLTGTGLVWYKYSPRKETSNYTEDIQRDDQAGTLFFQQTAQIILTRREQNVRNEVYLLAQANMVMIVEDNNGLYWLLGQANGVTLINSPGGSGTAFGERNGYELNFEGKEPAPAIEVEYGSFSAEIQTETLGVL